MPREIKYLAWIDLETNAGDPQQILEFAMVVTDAFSPWAELADFESVVQPVTADALVGMPPVVEKMHTDNGLLAAIEAGEGIDLTLTDEMAAQMLGAIGEPHEFLIAGSGVAHFDRAIVRASMPKLNKFLQYPALDVGVIRRALRFAGRDDLSTKPPSSDSSPRQDIPHRAMADIRDHMAEWQLYAHLLGTIDALA